MNDAERELLLRLMQGNEDAAAFCEDAMLLAHFWDDLIDRDKPIDDHRINTAMWRIVVEMPRNPFYRQHFDTLNPVLMIAAIDWMTATGFEREPGACQDKHNVAMTLRSSYQNVLVMAAMLVGGPGYGINIAPALREYFHKEGLVEYRKRLRVEREQREQSNV